MAVHCAKIRIIFQKQEGGKNESMKKTFAAFYWLKKKECSSLPKAVLPHSLLV